MSTSKYSRFFMITTSAALLVLSVVVVPINANADTPEPPSDNGNCISCHDNLYYLHDTGKYFCLNESPMACADCHGGNPQATTQEEAHTLRAAHPVINEDISKCQECHPEQCMERIKIFDQKAGFSPVMVAGAYVPAIVVAGSSDVPVAEHEQPSAIILWQEGLMVAILVIFVLTIVFITRYRRGEKS